MTSAAHKDKDGNLRWYNVKGYPHRENGPAIEYTDGEKHWYVNGSRHRENGPAIEYADGEKSWWINNMRHRENGPAIEYANGQIEYYLNGETGPEIEQQVKENMARIKAEKNQQELLNMLSQDDDISAKIKTSSPKIPKKL